MEYVVWIKSGKTVNYYGECPNYVAKVGCFELICRPEIEYRRQKAHITSWQCDIYMGNKPLSGGPPLKSLKLCQEDAEKWIVQYLLGYGLVTLRALKRIGLLEEVLSEVGIDL